MSQRMNPERKRPIRPREETRHILCSCWAEYGRKEWTKAARIGVRRGRQRQKIIKTSHQNDLVLDVGVIWLQPLPPHWRPKLILMVCLACPSSLMTPCLSFPKPQPSRKRGAPFSVFSQRYKSSCLLQLEPPNKLSRMVWWSWSGYRRSIQANSASSIF